MSNFASAFRPMELDAVSRRWLSADEWPSTISHFPNEVIEAKEEPTLKYGYSGFLPSVYTLLQEIA